MWGGKEEVTVGDLGVKRLEGGVQVFCSLQSGLWLFGVAWAWRGYSPASLPSYHSHSHTHTNQMEPLRLNFS